MDFFCWVALGRGGAKESLTLTVATIPKFKEGVDTLGNKL